MPRTITAPEAAAAESIQHAVRYEPKLKVCRKHNKQQLIFVYKGKVKHFHVHLINYGNKYLFIFSDSLV